MPPWYVPSWLLPDFIWQETTHQSLADEIPPTPQVTHPLLRRFWGILHNRLLSFSQSYCRWVGIRFDNQIAQLPFGLVMKWSDGTRLEEVLAMQVARAAGFPVPKVICYGDHPDTPHAPVSILMTRVPGRELGQAYDTLNNEERDSIARELKRYLETMRRWKSLWGEKRICSLVGTSVRSVRIPFHYAGPCESEEEFNEYLLRPAMSDGFKSESEFNDALSRAKAIEKMPHRIVFTHGDLK
ncbi:Hypothetical protein R9X50_00684900 [Acrodontium crateriforme]|uniref:Aminoglycoside phosphotransferase domain-containing protein n=1 Tax=Acrodontium crateriforme TaxID=150365 RepID=A0AAQ3R739_9PEZI|nr:Hypothetical protein R9X50_00684900 [Acrodontium crateriforme]